ncbi:hypothetical protein F3Y22_tig00110432pilonHSYRG00125 [Hibiscus syriacus]|uniref:Pentatricopeptide repeat-containing protein n=1 Tax=Hibiscus syriacus TaxID=106335 RepID=A0A6A3AK57_HIBSY|nr:hypothetical protein F3Y22_tig00110432pilonHSYRG00125 [Hibiscus syriacus]
MLVNHADVWKTMEIDAALELFEKMRQHGCVPNINTYKKLINELCRVGRFLVAQKLIGHMRDQGISPGEDVYNSLLRCFCELEMYDDATTLPHLDSYRQLIRGRYDQGDKDKAETIFGDLLRCGYNCDEVAWNILIDGLLKKGLADRCTELLIIMEKMGFQLHPNTYSILIEGIEGA